MQPSPLPLVHPAEVAAAKKPRLAVRLFADRNLLRRNRDAARSAGVVLFQLAAASCAKRRTLSPAHWEQDI